MDVQTALGRYLEAADAVAPGFVEGLAARIAEELRTGSPEPAPGQRCFGACCANPRSNAPVAPGLASEPLP